MMILKSKIRWRSLLSNVMLFLFFTLPLLGLPFIDLSTTESNQKLWTRWMFAIFTIPIGLMPMHLLLHGYVAVSCTESGIIFKKYFGFWKKEYSYKDLRTYSRNSYQRAKGSSKRYAVLNVLFSDGKTYQIDERNIANYQQICKHILAEGNMEEDAKVIHDDGSFYIWLFYILIATVGVGVIFVFSKFKLLSL